MDGLQSEVAGTALSGPLRVEVDEALLHGLLLPALPSFFEANPGITLHLGPPTPTGLEPAGASPDCALRLSRTTTASGSVPIGRLSRGTFASPGHLGRGGTKEIDLATCALVGLRTRTGELLAFDLPTERSAPTPPLVATVQSELAAIGLAKLGLGLVQVHRCLVEADLASGALVEVHPDSPPGASLVHLLRPDGALSPRLRAFVGWVGERIEPALLRS